MFMDENQQFIYIFDNISARHKNVAGSKFSFLIEGIDAT